MLYETLVKIRMNTDERFWTHSGPLRGSMVIAAELYYENNAGLLRKIERATHRLLQLTRQQAEIELALWQDILRSDKTTARGLRSAICRVRNLCTALDRDDAFIQNEVEAFERQVRWRHAYETLNTWRAWRTNIRERARQERTWGSKPWSTENERKLRVKMRQDFRLADDSARLCLKRRLRDAGLTLADLGATKREIRLLSK